MRVNTVTYTTEDEVRRAGPSLAERLRGLRHGRRLTISCRSLPAPARRHPTSKRTPASMPPPAIALRFHRRTATDARCGQTKMATRFTIRDATEGLGRRDLDHGKSQPWGDRSALARHSEWGRRNTLKGLRTIRHCSSIAGSANDLGVDARHLESATSLIRIPRNAPIVTMTTESSSRPGESPSYDPDVAPWTGHSKSSWRSRTASSDPSLPA